MTPTPNEMQMARELQQIMQAVTPWEYAVSLINTVGWLTFFLVLVAVLWRLLCKPHLDHMRKTVDDERTGDRGDQ